MVSFLVKASASLYLLTFSFVMQARLCGTFEQMCGHFSLAGTACSPLVAIFHEYGYLETIRRSDDVMQKSLADEQ